MQTQLRKDKTMKNSNNNTYMFKGNETIKSVNDASFMFGKYVCRELEAIGMRSSYRHVMKPLMEQDGMTQLELVNLTQLKAPTISITLRNMEREGIVRREKNDVDRRETHVYITEKGREMHAKILEAFDRAAHAEGHLREGAGNRAQDPCKDDREPPQGSWRRHN